MVVERISGKVRKIKDNVQARVRFANSELSRLGSDLEVYRRFAEIFPYDTKFKGFLLSPGEEIDPVEKGVRMTYKGKALKRELGKLDKLKPSEKTAMRIKAVKAIDGTYTSEVSPQGTRVVATLDDIGAFSRYSEGTYALGAYLEYKRGNKDMVLKAEQVRTQDGAIICSFPGQQIEPTNAQALHTFIQSRSVDGKPWPYVSFAIKFSR